MRYVRIWQYFFACIIVFSLVSCSTAKMMDKGIASYYGNTIPKPRKNDFINFSVATRMADDKVSVNKRTKNKLIPALFYWKLDKEHTMDINQLMPLNNFASAFMAQVNAKKLKEKLNGATVDIVLKNNPANFHVINQEWYVWLILVYFGESKFYIDAVYEDFSVDYTINYPSGNKKTGNLIVKNLNRAKAPRLFQALKNMIPEYMAASDANMKIMAKDLANKFVAETETP
jgi:hypothetical protein